jgi:glycosyl transferase family 25
MNPINYVNTAAPTWKPLRGALHNVGKTTLALPSGDAGALAWTNQTDSTLIQGGPIRVTTGIGVSVHVYVINLARSTNRRAHIVAELEKTGLDYEIVPAIDGFDLDLQDPSVVDPALIAKNDFPAGTAGCAMSHLRVYERIMADGLENALVLEDDVTLPVDLGNIADALVPHLTGAEVALLNYASAKPCRMSKAASVTLPMSRLLALPIDIRSVVNAAAYVITREACESMLSGALPLRANADDWNHFYQEGMLDRVRCVLPLAVDKSAAFESTIGLYSMGNGIKSRIVRPLVSHRIPIVHHVVLHRRQRILRRWGRSELVDAPFVEKPSRLE